MTSWALWVPLVWVIIIGTRPISVWFGTAFDIEAPASYQDGSLLDGIVYFLLIILGLLVLFERKVNWGVFIGSNRWLFAFFLYCGISVLWSNDSFISFKRWFKDFGNVVMIFVILTERDPVQATKALLSRFTNFVIPFSVIFIKYFPELGRYYIRWSWQVAYSGIALEKNALGAIVFICGIFLVWDLIEIRTAGKLRTDTADLFGRAVLLSMVFWLISMADSQTAFACLVLGVSILILMRPSLSVSRARYLGRFCLSIGAIILLLYFFHWFVAGPYYHAW